MTPTNRQKSVANARATKAKRGGGERRGAGRPLGSKDSLPRKGTVSEDDRFRALQAEYGRLHKRAEDLQRQVDDLRFQLNYGKQFPGDSKALLTATYKAEYYPSQEQLYAANKMLDKEHPAIIDNDGNDGGVGRVHLYLPHNHRDDELVIKAGHFTQEDLDRYHEGERKRLEEVEKKDERLRRLVMTGELTVHQAQTVRPLYTQHGDPLWKPPPAPARPALLYYPPEPETAHPNGHAGVSDVSIERDKPEAAAERYNAEPELVDMLAPPRSRWQVGTRIYVANANGVIPGVAAEDVDELLALGAALGLRRR